MRCPIALILLISTASAGGAAAQNPARSIDDLIRQTAPPPPGLYLSDPVLRPDGPPSAEDNAYENRVISTFRTAQVAQGELDGRWQVRNVDGAVIYLFQFADPGAGPARVEGVWRDPQKIGFVGTGFIDSVSVEDGDTIFLFRESESQNATRVRLHRESSSRWSGQATGADGTTRTIVMVRDAGIETRALGLGG